MLTIAKAFIFALVFAGSIGNALASQEYSITVFFSGKNPNYIMNLYTPEGKEPNSECMEDWKTPASPVTLTHSTPFWISTIKDKNSGSCLNNPKYNTWKYDIRNGSTILSSGSFKFYHDRSSGEWETKIIADEADASRAICRDKDREPHKCLNEFFRGKTDDISIVFNP